MQELLNCQEIVMAGSVSFDCVEHDFCICVTCIKIPFYSCSFSTLILFIMEDPVISTQPIQDGPASRITNNNTLYRSGTSMSRTVRVNWLKFLFYTWKRISVLSKLVVSCNVVLVIAQVQKSCSAYRYISY